MPDHQQGNASFAAIAAFAVLAFTALLTKNYGARSSNAIKLAQIENISASARQKNLSNFSMLRGMVTPSQIKPGVYEPVVYPANYFEADWDLKTNHKFNELPIKSDGNAIFIKSFSNQELSTKEAEIIFNSSQFNLSDLLSSESSLRIIGFNRDISNGYYVKSIDVVTSSNASKPAARNQNTVGRIFLKPPNLLPFTLKVKGPGDLDFGENFGTKEKPLPVGEYQFAVIASGIVHHAVLQGAGGGSLVLGLKDNKVAHKANNIHAENILIGATDKIPIGVGDLKADHVKMEKCEFVVDKEGEGADGSNNVTLSAKLIGVDGFESETTLVKTLFIKNELSNSEPGQLACQKMCPISAEGDVTGNDEKFIKHLDLAFAGGVDKRNLDYLHSGRTKSIIEKGAKGIICDNLELVAKNVSQLNNGLIPSEAQKINPQRFQKSLDYSMRYLREYSYMAPNCKRELVGARTDCGCFEANTMILMGDGTEQEVSAIRAGDIVYNPKTGRNQAVKQVIAGPEVKQLLTLSVKGRLLTVTVDHPFLAMKGLKRADELQIGEMIVHGDTTVQIDDLSAEERGLTEVDPIVWNFELEGDSIDENHYVLANGVMTGDLYIQRKLKPNR
ncbi:MAG: hypothetical protein EOP48_00455 [Sphingobacteriales bacterium]|nr:MAG: hypothetical protein EOP48_00455 [Sphingobacteriales bacterium]